ncbi:MAG: dienelactone hydrolase family protein, partial [Sphingomonadales bacterium]|nr:dienelactone hydrolase family protein [Sphingomonadales bacterium]
MCDDFNQSAEDEALARKGLSRLEFAALGAAAAIAACSGSDG